MLPVMMIDKQKMDKKKQKKKGICGYHPENDEHLLKKKKRIKMEFLFEDKLIPIVSAGDSAMKT